MDPDQLATDFFLAMLIGGYGAAILALTSQRWAIPSRTLAFGGGFGVLIGLAGYGLTPFGGALHLASGWLVAPYVLAFPMAALGLPVLAGKLAANGVADQDGQTRQDGPSDAQIRQGVLAGLTAGIVAALIITVFTIITMLLFPDRVTLEHDGLGPPIEYPANREVRRRYRRRLSTRPLPRTRPYRTRRNGRRLLPAPPPVTPSHHRNQPTPDKRPR